MQYIYNHVSGMTWPKFVERCFIIW